MDDTTLVDLVAFLAKSIEHRKRACVHSRRSPAGPSKQFSRLAAFCKTAPPTREEKSWRVPSRSAEGRGLPRDPIPGGSADPAPPAGMPRADSAEPVDSFPCVAATPAASHALPRTAFAAWNDYVCWGCAVTPSVCEAAVARVARNNPPGICPSSVRIRTTLKAQAALACADPDPAALTGGVSGRPIGLSEWVRWGNLRPELG